MSRVATLAVLVCTCTVLAGQQARDTARPPSLGSGSGQITGTVVTADESRTPLRRALVTLTGEGAADRVTAATDDAGTFAFTGLPPNRYSLSVAKAGYVPMNYGSKRPGGSGTPIVLADGQKAVAAFTLIRGSVIVGTVRDALGSPLPGVTVTALRYATSFETGARALQSVSIGSTGQMDPSYSPDAFPGTGVTDDRGEYRIYGLAAGEYVVSAAVRPWGSAIGASTDVHQVTQADIQAALQLLRGPGIAAAGDPAAKSQPADASRVDYVAVYHPAAVMQQDAATIALGPAEERAGIDVMLRLVPTAAVSGFIAAPDGTPIVGAQVSIMDPMPEASRVLKATRSDEDGGFRIAGLPPNRYQLRADKYPEGLSGATEVTLEGRDVTSSFTLSPGVTLSGRVVFDGKTKPPETPPLVFLRKMAWVPSNEIIKHLPEGRFTFSTVAPGAYKLTINGRAPAGWILRSAMVNGVDVSDVVLEVKAGQNIDDAVVTLTDRPAEISGMLQNAAGQPAPDYVLIVFSADPRYWVPRSRRTQQVRPDLNGQFIARDLTAGDYLVAAVTDLENNQWNDPAFLKALAESGPIKVTVAEGERKLQNIRIGGR